jgi:hypothetical protein
MLKWFQSLDKHEQSLVVCCSCYFLSNTIIGIAIIIASIK